LFDSYEFIKHTEFEEGFRDLIEKFNTEFNLESGTLQIIEGIKNKKNSNSSVSYKIKKDNEFQIKTLLTEIIQGIRNNLYDPFLRFVEKDYKKFKLIKKEILSHIKIQKILQKTTWTFNKQFTEFYSKSDFERKELPAVLYSQILLDKILQFLEKYKEKFLMKDFKSLKLKMFSIKEVVTESSDLILKDLSNEELLCFYINIYNSFTIHSCILLEGNSFTDSKEFQSYLSLCHYMIENKKYSLQKIREIIGKLYSELSPNTSPHTVFLALYYPIKSCKQIVRPLKTENLIETIKSIANKYLMENIIFLQDDIIFPSITKDIIIPPKFKVKLLRTKILDQFSPRKGSLFQIFSKKNSIHSNPNPNDEELQFEFEKDEIVVGSSHENSISKLTSHENSISKITYSLPFSSFLTKQSSSKNSSFLNKIGSVNIKKKSELSISSKESSLDLNEKNIIKVHTKTDAFENTFSNKESFNQNSSSYDMTSEIDVMSFSKKRDSITEINHSNSDSQSEEEKEDMEDEELTEDMEEEFEGEDIKVNYVGIKKNYKFPQKRPKLSKKEEKIYSYFRNDFVFGTSNNFLNYDMTGYTIEKLDEMSDIEDEEKTQRKKNEMLEYKKEINEYFNQKNKNNIIEMKNDRNEETNLMKDHIIEIKNQINQENRKKEKRNKRIEEKRIKKELKELKKEYLKENFEIIKREERKRKEEERLKIKMEMEESNRIINEIEDRKILIELKRIKIERKRKSVEKKLKEENERKFKEEEINKKIEIEKINVEKINEEINKNNENNKIEVKKEKKNIFLNIFTKLNFKKNDKNKSPIENEIILKKKEIGNNSPIILIEKDEINSEKINNEKIKNEKESEEEKKNKKRKSLIHILNKKIEENKNENKLMKKIKEKEEENLKKKESKLILESIVLQNSFNNPEIKKKFKFKEILQNKVLENLFMDFLKSSNHHYYLIIILEFEEMKKSNSFSEKKINYLINNCFKDIPHEIKETFIHTFNIGRILNQNDIDKLFYGIIYYKHRHQ
jgi:hypothetical protein